MHDIPSPRTVASPTVSEETRARERSPSAQVAEDWADVLFTVAGRMGRGLVPYGVLAFAGIELVSPDLLGQNHISSDLAQTLVGASLGALGVNMVGQRLNKTKVE
jgi:hypothetical protein